MVMISKLSDTYFLSDLCEIKYGKDYKKLSKGSIPVYGSGGVFDYVDNSIYKGESVLIPRKGTLSNIFYVDKEFWTVDTLFWTKINKELIIPRFLYYKLLTINFNELNVGSAVPSLTTDLLNKISLDIPTLETQQIIVNSLSIIDYKIEINNQINKNLEELAQTLYKQWFVDFEFPNEEGKPYKSSGGEMVESELGMIPKGWEVLPIKDKVEVVLGGTPSREIKDYWGGEVNWINSGKINDFRIISETEKITQIGLEKSAAKLMPIKTTVLAITGATLGQTSLLEIETSANQSVIGLIENDTFPYTYIFPLIQNEIDMIIQSQTGGAQQHINKNDVESYRILTPIFEILSSFDKLIGPSYELISNNLFENKHLSDLRDLLLPKLMSGEIEV
jgi:type I restriction enzyme S subunit